MTAPTVGLTDAELRLAEQYVRVLDFVSRCAQAIDRGDWFYLYEKAAQLEDAAGRLATIAAETLGPDPRRHATAPHRRHARGGGAPWPPLPRRPAAAPPCAQPQGGGVVSDLVELRVIAAPEVAAQTVARLAELLEPDRQSGPYPSRKTPGLVMYYLTGRLRHAAAALPPRGRRGAALPGRVQ